MRIGSGRSKVSGDIATSEENVQGYEPDDEDLPLEQVVVVDEAGREAINGTLAEL